VKKSPFLDRLPQYVLILDNLIYATSYAALRLTLPDMPPATLALARLAIGGLVLLPFIRKSPQEAPLTGKDGGLIAAMGIIGFGAALWLGNLGIAASTATNASLLIVVEPIALMLLGPLLLDEKLLPQECVGAGVALVGSIFVVINGIPGATVRLAPHWKGDFLLILSGLSYAAYSLFGRGVLGRISPQRVTTLSIFWGAASMLPFAMHEWTHGQRPLWTTTAVVGTLYLAVVVTALSFFMWNWALKRVESSRAAIFINIQPAAGALIGIFLLGERPTLFTLLGGALIVGGLVFALKKPAGP
jgi:drug/metabolite transporter (DMT)-like permease